MSKTVTIRNEGLHKKEKKMHQPSMALKERHATRGKNLKSKTILKRSTLGMEFEFLILNTKGEVVPQATALLKKIGEKNKDALSHIIHEVSENQIEVGTYPSVGGAPTLKSLVDHLKLLLLTAEEEGLVICPLATYPGKFTPKIKLEIKHYRNKHQLLGRNFLHTGRVVGFHFHYALPWGVYDTKKQELKKLVHSKNKQSLVNAYNFLIAADPALATFSQSSPFYQGKFFGKDARMLVYRAFDEVLFPHAVYVKYPQFSTLPPYQHTLTDIIHHIDKCYDDWMRLLEMEAKLSSQEIAKYPSKLMLNWSPVRINAHGTLEQRGMDMNHFTTIGSLTLLLSKILRAIQEDYYQVVSSDMAIQEPFKIEKKTIFIPPDTYVIKELQKETALKGMESERLWYYCKRLMWLAKLIEGKKIEPLLEPLEKMIKDKKTLADEVIEQAKKLGYTNFKKNIPQEIASAIALDQSKILFKEIVLIEQFIQEIEK